MNPGYAFLCEQYFRIENCCYRNLPHKTATEVLQETVSYLDSQCRNMEQIYQILKKLQGRTKVQYIFRYDFDIFWSFHTDIQELIVFTRLGLCHLKLSSQNCTEVWTYQHPKMAKYVLSNCLLRTFDFRSEICADAKAFV